MIHYHDPRASVATPMDAYTLFHQFSSTGAGTTIGLLANGFPDSENFLNRLGEVMQQRLPDARLRHWNKGNPTVTASAKMLDQIRSSCQVVVAAYGH